ncbi:putative cuticle collagen 75 [Diplonema papillatum]|nr:putative cuticle collagen 75 [Diplonema papillatum]
MSDRGSDYSTPLLDLVAKDAYAVLPPQPLGDYLQAIVEALKDLGQRLAASEEREKTTAHDVTALADLLPQVQDNLKEVGESLHNRLTAVEASQADADEEDFPARIQALTTRLDTMEVDLPQTLNDRLEEQQQRAAEETTAIAADIAGIAATLRQLQGGRPDDLRLRAIEADLTRPLTPFQSNPITLRLAAPLTRFEANGGARALRASIAEKVDLLQQEVHVIASPSEDAPGETTVALRVAYAGFGKVGKRQESTAVPAEALVEQLCNRFNAGTAGSVMADIEVAAASRPDPLLFEFFAQRRGRVGFGRRQLGSVCTGVISLLCDSMRRLHDAEFWIRNARAYYDKLRRFQRKRWTRNKPAIAAAAKASALSTLARYWGKLSRHLSAAKRDRRRLRACRAVEASADMHARRRCHRQALAWLAARKERAKRDARRQRALNTVARSADDALRRFYLGKATAWLDTKLSRRKRAGRVGGGAADNLLLKNNMACRRSFFSLLRAFAKKRKARRRVVANRELANQRLLTAKYYGQWSAFVRKRRAHAKAHRRRIKALHELTTRTLRNSLRRPFDLLKINCRQASQYRQQAVMDNVLNCLDNDARVEAKFDQVSERCERMLTDLSQRVGGHMQTVSENCDDKVKEMTRKCETLGVQVDVGLKTLSNTNSVLNKLVDRLISVDEQLDHLDREKVNRQELGTRRPGDPFSAGPHGLQTHVSASSMMPAGHLGAGLEQSRLSSQSPERGAFSGSQLAGSYASGALGMHGMPGGPPGSGVSGFPGSSGAPGMPGMHGMPGMSGMPGSSGLPGAHGMVGSGSGASGFPGSSGAPGASGMHGMPGMSGMPGASGAPGMHGVSGMPGMSGMPGASGAPGMHGVSGMPGMSGMPGSYGGSGAHGAPGVSGSPGSPGRHGMPGLGGTGGYPGSGGMHGVSGSGVHGGGQSALHGGGVSSGAASGMPGGLPSTTAGIHAAGVQLHLSQTTNPSSQPPGPVPTPWQAPAARTAGGMTPPTQPASDPRHMHIRDYRTQLPSPDDPRGDEYQQGQGGIHESLRRRVSASLGADRKQISPPRNRPRVVGDPLTPVHDKEAQQWQLLQKDRQRLREAEARSASAVSQQQQQQQQPVPTGQPLSAEEALQRARQWQRNRTQTSTRAVSPQASSDKAPSAQRPQAHTWRLD